MQKELLEAQLNVNRRNFFSKLSIGVGSLALGSLLVPDLFKQERNKDQPNGSLAHFAPKAKRVIYLFQSGAPSQLESFDYKPALLQHAGQEIPPSVRGNQRLTSITSEQAQLPLVPSVVPFQQYGQNGTWISNFFPNIGRIVDDICIIRSMHTEAINHDPGVTFFQTGSQQSGRPSMGSWLSYGLGSENENLPAFVVLASRGWGHSQGLYTHLWSSGFLDSIHQGVMLRAGNDPVLYLKDPPGISRTDRRRFLDQLTVLNHLSYDKIGDPETLSRLQQYEMAYRMQMSVPELTNVKEESAETIKLYGLDALTPGTYAYNCLMARRLAERGVRFIQLYHQGWDQHGNLPIEMEGQARDVDQASAALVIDLKRRGLLEDTLVIWGGEFGRTAYCQGPYDPGYYGRDHHPRCFTIWMAGGGIRPGLVYGETDEFSYNILRDPVHVHDFQATLLHLIGLDHEKLIFKHHGRRFRLTDVGGKVVKAVLS